jgi:hypothetical protein
MYAWHPGDVQDRGCAGAFVLGDGCLEARSAVRIETISESAKGEGNDFGKDEIRHREDVMGYQVLERSMCVSLD